MARVRKIKENELVGGTADVELYPVTSDQAVFNSKNEALDSVLRRRGIINISTEYNDGHVVTPYSLSTAIKAVPAEDRQRGFIGEFVNSNGNWITVRFNGGDTRTWENVDEWSQLPIVGTGELDTLSYPSTSHGVYLLTDQNGLIKYGILEVYTSGEGTVQTLTSVANPIDKWAVDPLRPGVYQRIYNDGIDIDNVYPDTGKWSNWEQIEGVVFIEDLANANRLFKLGNGRFRVRWSKEAGMYAGNLFVANTVLYRHFYFLSPLLLDVNNNQFKQKVTSNNNYIYSATVALGGTWTQPWTNMLTQAEHSTITDLGLIDDITALDDVLETGVYLYALRSVGPVVSGSNERYMFVTKDIRGGGSSQRRTIVIQTQFLSDGTVETRQKINNYDFEEWKNPNQSIAHDLGTISVSALDSLVEQGVYSYTIGEEGNIVQVIVTGNATYKHIKQIRTTDYIDSMKSEFSYRFADWSSSSGYTWTPWYPDGKAAGKIINWSGVALPVSGITFTPEVPEAVEEVVLLIDANGEGISFVGRTLQIISGTYRYYADWVGRDYFQLNGYSPTAGFTAGFTEQAIFLGGSDIWTLKPNGRLAVSTGGSGNKVIFFNNILNLIESSTEAQITEALGITSDNTFDDILNDILRGAFVLNKISADWVQNLIGNASITSKRLEVGAGTGFTIIITYSNSTYKVTKTSSITRELCKLGDITVLTNNSSAQDISTAIGMSFNDVWNNINTQSSITISTSNIPTDGTVTDVINGSTGTDSASKDYFKLNFISNNNLVEFTAYYSDGNPGDYGSCVVNKYPIKLHIEEGTMFEFPIGLTESSRIPITTALMEPAYLEVRLAFTYTDTGGVIRDYSYPSYRIFLEANSEGVKMQQVPIPFMINSNIYVASFLVVVSIDTSATETNINVDRFRLLDILGLTVSDTTGIALVKSSGYVGARGKKNF